MSSVSPKFTGQNRIEARIVRQQNDEGKTWSDSITGSGVKPSENGRDQQLNPRTLTQSARQ